MFYCTILFAKYWLVTNEQTQDHSIYSQTKIIFDNEFTFNLTLSTFDDVVLYSV